MIVSTEASNIMQKSKKTPNLETQRKIILRRRNVRHNDSNWILSEDRWGLGDVIGRLFQSLGPAKAQSTLVDRRVDRPQVLFLDNGMEMAQWNN